MCWFCMSPPDDIPLDPAVSETAKPDPSESGRRLREIGPESEVRGGPEAADESLDEAEPAPSQTPAPSQRSDKPRR